MLVVRQRLTLIVSPRVSSTKPSVIAPPAITEWIRLDPPGAESWTAPVSPDGGRLLCVCGPLGFSASRAVAVRLRSVPPGTIPLVTPRVRRLPRAGYAPVASRLDVSTCSVRPKSSQSPVTVSTRRNAAVGLITTNRLAPAVAVR
jgi:hypothetical protein